MTICLPELTAVRRWADREARRRDDRRSASAASTVSRLYVDQQRPAEPPHHHGHLLPADRWRCSTRSTSSSTVALLDPEGGGQRAQGGRPMAGPGQDGDREPGRDHRFGAQQRQRRHELRVGVADVPPLQGLAVVGVGRAGRAGRWSSTVCRNVPVTAGSGRMSLAASTRPRASGTAIIGYRAVPRLAC